MGKRQIIRIDQDKCDGCGMCVPSCAEGAIQIVDGKAQLLADRFCDGLGACLGECPQGALIIEEREAEEFVGPAPGAGHPEAPAPPLAPPGEGFVCPGSRMQQFQPAAAPTPGASALGHWPIKLRLVAPQAPFLKGASLLVAADCAPFAAGDFHSRFLEGKALVCGCPKFDDVPEHVAKLTAILRENDIQEIRHCQYGSAVLFRIGADRPPGPGGLGQEPAGDHLHPGDRRTGPPAAENQGKMRLSWNR